MKGVKDKTNSREDVVAKLRAGIRIPWLLPRLYIKILILGLVLVGLNYSYIQNLTYCSSLFEENFCSPVGIYLIAFASLPGYLVINALLPNVAANNDSLYSLIVFITSLITYSVLGFVFTKSKEANSKLTAVSYLVFLFLILVILLLVTLIRG